VTSQQTPLAPTGVRLEVSSAPDLQVSAAAQAGAVQILVHWQGDFRC
jgi:hypothetical protein